jgi:DNA-binding LacI/PurR family transcriptional regulator
MPLDWRKPVPLYMQMAEDISSKISAGALRVGDQLGSQQELSREYRVSLMTVKKALAALTHQGWIYTRIGKGSFVARQSPVPPAEAHRSIGIVLENLRSAFFSLIVQALEDSAYRRGYNILLSNSSGQTEKEELQIRHFRKIGVSGLIIASLRHEYHATPTFQMLRREGFPFVMVSYMDDPEIPFVGTNHEGGAYLATQHLIGVGYKRIGYVNAERGNLVGEMRKEGFKRAMRDAGRQVKPRFLYRIQVHGIRDYFQGGYDVGRRFLRLRGQRPDALFIYNDSAALGFEKAVLEGGLRIPDDVALVGFDNISEGNYASVPLTTIEQPMTKIGAEAIDLLIRQIEGRPTESRSVFMPSLVIRDSCGHSREIHQASNRGGANNHHSVQRIPQER